MTLPELPNQLEVLARVLAYKSYLLFPQGRCEIEDLYQEARLSALEAYTTFDPSKRANIITYAYRVIKSDLSNLLTNETRQKRNGRAVDIRLDEMWEHNPLLENKDARFEYALINKLYCEQLVEDMNISDDLYKWGILVNNGYTQWDADLILGKKKGWGGRECDLTRQRYKRKRLKALQQEQHRLEMKRRAAVRQQQGNNKS